MNKLWTLVLVVVVALVALYGGYRLYKHYNKPQMVVVPTEAVSPTMAAENSVYKVVSSSTLGNYLTDTKGMTLYTYAKDTAGVSNCTGQCLVVWPAYVAPASASALPTNVTTVKRDDGTMQYAYKGMPLYYYTKDTKAGDTMGQGVAGVWSVAKE